MGAEHRRFKRPISIGFLDPTREHGTEECQSQALRACYRRKRNVEKKIERGMKIQIYGISKISPNKRVPPPPKKAYGVHIDDEIEREIEKESTR